MLNQQQYEAKWPEIKSGIRTLWGRLTEDEIEMAKGNSGEIISLVEERYNETKHDIKSKLDQLMDSFDNDTDKNIDPDISSYHRSPLMDDQAPSTGQFRSGFGVGTGTADAQDETLHDRS